MAVDDLEEANEAISEVLRARDFLRETRFLDLIEIDEEIRKLKEEVKFMRYKPWEWFKRDEKFQRALMNEIDKRVAREVEQGLMFILYKERPEKVVEMVNRVVKDYLKKWEVGDQIAQQMVRNVVTKPDFIDYFLKLVSPYITRMGNRINAIEDKVEKMMNRLGTVEGVIEDKFKTMENRVKEMEDKLKALEEKLSSQQAIAREALKDLEEYDVLEKESRDRD
ncbi:hypothetical protein DRO97_08120 [Archaeoglobales archaeon]|nr:MAG: hypothetical protein DRO97_08120 [Archaeoglobales archaeon]